MYINTSYVLLLIIGFYSCSRISSNEKSNIDFSQFDQLWFVKYRKSTPASIDWVPVKGENVELLHKNKWLERMVNDTVFAYGLDSLDEKKIISAIVQSKKNTGIFDIVSYLNMVEKDVKSDTTGKSVLIDFYEVPITKNSSLIFGNIIFNSYTIKMCFIDDEKNIYEFMMSLPTDSFNSTRMEEFNQFINSFKYNDVSVVFVRDSFTVNKIID